MSTQPAIPVPADIAQEGGTGMATPTGAAGGDLGGTYPSPSVVALRGFPIAPGTPTSGQTLEFTAGEWTPVTTGGGPPSGAAGGDLGSTFPNPTVVAIRGVAVSATAPTAGQVLTLSGGVWTPTTPSAAPSGAAGGDLGSTYPNPQVVATHLGSPLPAAQGGTGAGSLAGVSLSSFGAPTASLGAGGQKITNLANGTASSDAAAFGQIPTAGTGLVITAGVLTPDPTIVAELATTQTLTNKRITKRVLELSTNGANPRIDTDNYDVVHITAQTATIASFTTNLTGTPVDGDTLRISITGTASVSITWGASFESSTVPLPATTSGTARIDIGFVWNTETANWRCVAVA